MYKIVKDKNTIHVKWFGFVFGVKEIVDQRVWINVANNETA